MMDSHSTHDNGPDSVSYGGGVANPQQQQQQSSAESNLGLPDVVYGFMLLLSNVSALLAFTIMSSDKLSDKITKTVYSDDTGTSSTEKHHFEINFDDYTTLNFSVFVAVVVWIWTLGLLALVVATQILEAWAETVEVGRFVKRGNAAALLFAYTAAVGCASFSTSCKNHNYAAIPDYDDHDVKDDVEVFCNKVGASCTFLWFAFLGLGSAVVLKLYMEGRLENMAWLSQYENMGGPQGATHNPFGGPQEWQGAGQQQQQQPLPGVTYGGGGEGDEEFQGQGVGGCYNADAGESDLRNSFKHSEVVSSADL